MRAEDKTLNTMLPAKNKASKHEMKVVEVIGNTWHYYW